MTKEQYQAVIEAFRDGTINSCDWQLLFDEDSGYWKFIGDRPYSMNDEQFEHFKEVEQDRMAATYGTPKGDQDLIELAQAAGINANYSWV